MAFDRSEDDKLGEKFKSICASLNLDSRAADEALNTYKRIQMNYTLEGEKLHWLACALFVACRKSVSANVRGAHGEGNSVSLTKILRLCELSLVNFFEKIKKWSEMANLSQVMRNRLDRLEKNFNVSTVIFKKYEPIFLDIFKNPISSPMKTSRARKQRGRYAISSSDVFSFCWTLFIYVKSNFSAISDDLVNSFHLLLACIDFCYNNILVSEYAKEIINPSFSGLPRDFHSENFEVTEPVACLIQALCTKWQGLGVESKGIKEHWWKPCIKRMVEKKILRCTKTDDFTGFFTSDNFDYNL